MLNCHYTLLSEAFRKLGETGEVDNKVSQGTFVCCKSNVNIYVIVMHMERWGRGRKATGSEGGREEGREREKERKPAKRKWRDVGRREERKEEERQRE